MTNILTTQATDDDTLATEAGNPYPVHLVPPSALVGLLGLNHRQDFNAAALVAAASPASVVDAPYTPAAAARGVRVSCFLSGNMDAGATLSAQLKRGAVNVGPLVTIVSDAGGLFGGGTDAVDSPPPGAVAYSLVLTSAGRTFDVPIGSAGFAINDLL